MIPNVENRSMKTVKLFCYSLNWDYSKIEEGNSYTYNQLRELIKDEEGGELPKRHGGKGGRRDIQFDAWKITLDLQECGDTKDKTYLVTKKNNFSLEDKADIIEEITQEYLLSRDNKSGLIYNIVLLLLMLRGKTEFGPATRDDNNKANLKKDLKKYQIIKSMEFSKNKWEVEIGMISRVFQKVLFNGNNILTQSIIGNILKTSVDEVKKNVFLRALEFMSRDPEIVCRTNTKVLYIDTLRGESANMTDAEAAAAHKIKYQNKYYDYNTTYANDIFNEMVSVIEEQVLEEMEFETRKELVGSGKYPLFKTKVAKKVADLEVDGLVKIPLPQDGKNHDYKILNYWKVYEVEIPLGDLTNRVKKIITSNEFEDEEVAGFLKQLKINSDNNSNNLSSDNNSETPCVDDDTLLDHKILESCLASLKKELNEYVEMRVLSKVDLENYDFDTKEGKSVADELAWISYFSKYAQYRIYSQKDWENFLFGAKEQTVEKDGVKFIYKENGVISGMIDDNYNRINFETGEVDKDSVDDITAIAALDQLASKIIGDNKSLIKAREDYSKKMASLMKSIILSNKGELNEYGFDLEAMNKKIRELMEMQFKPQENALKIARKIIAAKKNKK